MGDTRRPVVAGNWKLHGTLKEAVDLAREVARLTAMVREVDVVVAPPFTAIHEVARRLKDTHVAVAGQDCHFEERGAFTGEVAPSMLKDAGCEWVIVGHSERRQLFGETDEAVGRKAVAALKAALRPIVCVGETGAERDAGRTLAVVSRQIEAAFRGVDAAQARACVLAYEPVWAIGTGRTATPEQAQEVHHAARDLVGRLLGAEVAAGLRILYGGSVKPDNVDALMACADIDGALVGGASLKAADFARIVKFEP
jgi:triosephosphate isomerase